MSTQVFEWEAPPPRPRGRYARTNEIAMRLGKNRGNWAKIGVYKTYSAAHVRAHQIRTGKIKGFKVVGLFQVDVRLTPDGYAVYAKCIKVTRAFKNSLDPNNPKNWTLVEEDDEL